MTKKEIAILNEMKETAVRNYFELKGTKDEDLKKSPGYDTLLDKYLCIACEYIEIKNRLEQGA